MAEEVARLSSYNVLLPTTNVSVHSAHIHRLGNPAIRPLW
jgi:hypothetical protein